MPKVSDDDLARRRTDILDAARTCFYEYGYEGATVRRLEEATGRKRGAIFHHFGDKQGLFIALAREDALHMAELTASHGIIDVIRSVTAGASAAASRSTDPTEHTSVAGETAAHTAVPGAAPALASEAGAATALASETGAGSGSTEPTHRPEGSSSQASLAEGAEGYKWALTRIELLRLLRTDPSFSERWEKEEHLIDDAIRQRIQAQIDNGTMRTDIDAETIYALLDIVFEGVFALIGQGKNLDHVGPALDVVETSVRKPTVHPRTRVPRAA